MDDLKHIGVVDGIRALAIVFIAWYHIWQQSWLTPYVDLGIFRRLGITMPSFSAWVRYGFVYVDILILISAFCNFLPYARSIVLGEPWPDTREFYLKRAARIFPSYYLCIAVFLFVFALPGGQYTDAGFMWKDILTRLTFTSPLWPGVTMLNGVLWTVQIEVLFYLLLPWLAKAFQKYPVRTYLALLFIGILSSEYVVAHHFQALPYYVDHALTFTGVYANGMLVSTFFVYWKKHGTNALPFQLAATALSLCCFLWMGELLLQYESGENLQVVQLTTRLPQSMLFSVFIFSTACSVGLYQKLFSNRLMRFICAISYNLYIWHQVVAFKLKEFRIPYYEGSTPPNMLGDTDWQWKYQNRVIVLSLLIAVLLTYGFERPIRRYLLQKWKIRTEPSG